MKYLTLLTLFFCLSSTAFGKIYDSFMCYTHVNTVVLFGILKEQPTLRLNYYRLDQNPTTIDLKIKKYDRSSRTIEAIGSYQGQDLIHVKSQNGSGVADINLMPFPGSEDVSFENEDVLCYFGKFED